MTTLFISHSSKDTDWALKIRKALREQGYELLFLDFHPDDGIHAGAEWERMLWQKLRQSRGVVVLGSANWVTSPWCVAEAMIARERGKKLFVLEAPNTTDAARIPDFLKDRQHISVADKTTEEVHQRLFRGLEAEGLRDEFPRPKRPYPGLAPFQETDAAVFFGRGDEISTVIDVLNRRGSQNAKGFIVVLGASGCGKSSLIRAGVLSRLRASDDGARAAWVVVPPFVAGKGLDGLAVAMAQAFQDAGRPQELRTVRTRLAAADDLRTLANELLLARGAADGWVLLVLDQLEEVFGTPPGSKARAALRLLLDASAEASGPVVVLATMRSDFLDAFQRTKGAARRYEEVTLDPMLPGRFSEVIEGPADRFGLDLDAGLCGRMVAETAYDDALPLLAFTLEKLYEKCRAEGRLTLAAYGELGGVSAAIAHEADAVIRAAGHAGLPPDDPRMRDLRRAFFSLARVGDEGQFTRRIARWSQMPTSCKAVLDRFVDRRLLVSGGENGAPTLAVAHEALFRVWGTLRGWLEKDRKALALREQIEDAAAEWLAENRAESRAWAEERIIDAIAEIDRSGVSLDDVRQPALVREFVGPTDPQELRRLPALVETEDASAGSGRYGELWRMPLGHAARASLGVRLALLGDRRPGVGQRVDDLPEIAWRGIDGGAVTIEIRADPNAPSSDVVDTRTAAVARFAMARYPITVDQFQTFLQDCHRDGRWHLPPGFPIIPADYPPPKHRARHGNHPADSVNWYDAMAFCHWLSARLEQEVRLPTEFEWQLAATGGDPANTYPWGPDWVPQKEPWRANTLESDLNRVTAVGLYPLGASKAGVLDLAGTIYEWCLNEFDDPDEMAFHTETRPRVVRGGSWHYFQDFARCAVRFRGSPDGRFFGVGFRVVSSSPIAKR